MKRRETKGWQEDAGRSTLVRSCSRWLTFARGLARGKGRRMAAADTLAFIESLYGGRFTSVEGSAFSLDKVYRTAGGGGLFISKTRLSLSVHPRFDLRLLNNLGGRTSSHVFKESPATLTLLSHGGVSGRGRQHDARYVTIQTWKVLPSSAERVPPDFSYVNLRGQRAQQAQGLQTSWPTVHVERVLLDGGATGTSAETSRPTVAPAGLRVTSLDLRHPFTHAQRQEFVSLLLNTYLPAVVSREVLNMKKTGGLSAASTTGATALGESERRPSAWTYAVTSPRPTPGGSVERRREFRTVETLKEREATRDPQTPLLHLLPHASLLSSLSETSLAELKGGAGHTTYHSSGNAPTLLLQTLRTHTAPTDTRGGSAPASAPHPLGQTPPRQATVTRDVLTSLHTFLERIHTTVARIKHAGNTTFITRPGFDATLRRGVGRVTPQQHGASSNAAQNHNTSINLFGRSVEFVRPASEAEFTREASTHDVGAQLLYALAPGVFSTQGVPGAGTFLFATRLHGRNVGTSHTEALSLTAATALRLAAAAETKRALRETRAARPEGMALELIRHRREQVLQLPRPGYVFTQPARAQLEERQVVTKTSREEIVEVVRREVRSLTSSANTTPAPSRADLAAVADEVYSTLVRRLLVEKERLGRF